MNTPWGTSDSQRAFEPGIGEVGTPRHGGIYITLDYAKKHLTAAAQKAAINQGGYLWFEEDADWMIPAWGLKHLWGEFFKYSRTPAAEWAQDIIDGLKHWNLTYALAAGIVPLDALPERYHCPNMFQHDNDQRLTVTDAGTVVCTCGHNFSA